MSRIVRLTVALLPALAGVACKSMPSGYRTPPAPLLDRPLIAPSFDERDSLLFEAQAAMHVFLIDNLVDRERAMRDTDEPLNQKAFRLIFAQTFRVRQLKDSSEAVRTPSFNPSFKYERHYLRGFELPSTLPNSSNRKIAGIRDLGFRAEWTHHSNGQAGCFRSGYMSDATGDPDNCTPGPTADPTGVELNRASGDFSTSYWGLTGFWRRIWLSSEDQLEKRAFDAGLGFQLHKWAGPGNMRDEQRALYGSYRGRLDLSYRQVFGHIQGRVEAQGELAEHTDSRITPWRYWVDLSFRSPRWLGAGGFMRVLDGQDYYNIGFAKRRQRVLIGFLLDPSGLEGVRGDEIPGRR